jgi:trans-2,3-dihydro-3-hydroxyanthranilate isomerase
MTTYPFVTLDVFTDTRFGGNPLAVFPNAEGMDTNVMQALAKELNISEVAFVLPPEDRKNDARVRIFTSQIEIDFAGHPNVGVAWVLAGERTDGMALRLEQKAGLVQVDVGPGPAHARQCTIAAPKPLQIGIAPSRQDVAACAGLNENDIGEPRLASVALATLCVEVSPEILERAQCNADAFLRLGAKHPDLSSICLLYLYSRVGESVNGRMFAPLSGTIEDPATGSAVSALVALLLSESSDDSLSLTVTQGIKMGRPSTMYASAKRTSGGVRAWVSGTCVPVLRGIAEV